METHVKNKKQNFLLDNNFFFFKAKHKMPTDSKMDVARGSLGWFVLFQKNPKMF